MVDDGRERGDIILSGLLRMVAGLLVLGVVLFDTGAVVVNRIQLDDAARGAARIGALTWAAERSARAAEDAVRTRVSREQDVTVQDIAFEAGRIIVTVTRPARVLLLHRLGPLAPWAQGTATSSSAAPVT